MVVEKDAQPTVITTRLPESVSYKILNVNVGVLGHVDSGKTSLVKALSTLLSTAALDKSTQSKERGMTLDLGFSCFFVPLPLQFQDLYPSKDQLQITLVDCPGHASLIRTIIGGAQIIDSVLLVIDAQKGWQAQTTECLVLAELTSPHLVVALNKVDLLLTDETPVTGNSSSSSSSFSSEVEARLQQVKKAVRERLATTRFAVAPIVTVSACVGGERGAARVSLSLPALSSATSTRVASDLASTNVLSSSSSTNTSSENATSTIKNETFNMDRLIQVLKDTLPPPRRASSERASFYFSIDHCFALRGRGTICTGTVVNGSIGVNDVLEFPILGVERKIKSIQMFKRQVSQIHQGDRAGVCVSNLDASLIERGIAATSGVVQQWKSAIALVRKVPYYLGSLPCGSKFHISVGHATVMATAHFWGARELNQQQHQNSSSKVELISDDTSCLFHGLSSTKKDPTTPLQSSSLGGGADLAGLPRIPFDFKQNFLYQESYLESVDDCVDKAVTPALNDIRSNQKLYPLHWALLEFQTPVYCSEHSLAIGSRLDTAIDNASGSVASCRLAFSARFMARVDPNRDLSSLRIYSMKVRRGVVATLGEPHTRQDDGKLVRYEVFGSELFKKETIMKPFIGMKIETEQGDVGEIKSSFGTSGKFRVSFPAGTEVREGDALILRFQRYAHDPTKKMYQVIQLPAARSGILLEKTNKKKKEKLPEGIKRMGEVSALKGDILSGGKHNMAIISGFFAPEVNIKEYAGARVLIPRTKETGTILGPFGKAGKCKVSFQSGVSADIGTKAELQM